MKKRLSMFIASALMLCGGTVPAQKGESVMFGDEVPSLKPGDGTSVKAGTRCEELLAEADALKGRPQRRSAAMARYEAECQGAPVAMPPQPAKP